VDLLGADGLRITAERIVFGEEEHAVALFAFPHRHTGAVPEGLRHLRLLVFVVTARAESTTKLVLVPGKTLEHHSGHTGVAAEVGAGALGIGFGEFPDHLKAFGRGLRVSSGRVGHKARTGMRMAGAEPKRWRPPTGQQIRNIRVSFLEPRAKVRPSTARAILTCCRQGMGCRLRTDGHEARF
jgi:hypothetical protein